MKKIRPLLISLPLGFILLVACKKEETSARDQLPAVTQTGANTFGCLLNGNVWIPKRKPSLFLKNLNGSYYFESGGNFNLSAYRYDPDTDIAEKIGFSIDNVQEKPGIWILSPRASTPYDNISFTYNDPKDNYFISADSTIYCKGTVQMTRVDVSNAIFSGTFEFTIKAPDSDTIRITDGRFDIKIGG